LIVAGPLMTRAQIGFKVEPICRSGDPSAASRKRRVKFFRDAVFIRARKFDFIFCFKRHGCLNRIPWSEPSGSDPRIASGHQMQNKIPEPPWEARARFTARQIIRSNYPGRGRPKHRQSKGDRPETRHRHCREEIMKSEGIENTMRYRSTPHGAAAPMPTSAQSWCAGAHRGADGGRDLC